MECHLCGHKYFPASFYLMLYQSSSSHNFYFNYYAHGMAFQADGTRCNIIIYNSCLQWLADKSFHFSTLLLLLLQSSVAQKDSIQCCPLGRTPSIKNQKVWFSVPINVTHSWVYPKLTAGVEKSSSSCSSSCSRAFWAFFSWSIRWFSLMASTSLTTNSNRSDVERQWCNQ